MKKLSIIVRSEKLDDVKAILDECGSTGATVSNLMGYGNQKGYKTTYRGSEYVVNLIPSVLSDPPNGGSLVPLRENRARAFCGINVYMSFFVYINRPVSIIYVHHYAASLSECRYLGCVFCNLMYRCTEDRTKVPCGIMDVLYNDHGSYIYY